MIKNEKLERIRGTYSEKELDEKAVKIDPFEQFSSWLEEAIKSDITEPNSMILSTSDNSNKPNARVVLLKEISNGGFVFFTNYDSSKSKELKENPNATILFFWRELGRQIRIMGKVKKINRKQSEEYFKTRPYESKIAAWASKQSLAIPGRNFLINEFDKYKEKFKNDVPLPPYWGGYVLVPSYFEFWQGRLNRLHDRIVYKKQKNGWKILRLAP
jgi:pyridoxamine 5'-phosphate oxidase